ncbi:MAG: hypothetical protein RMK29_00380 [Myxococcales bacterium]|nr:hypothetical protein [Myxococcota bacterium]MDW8280132.1 hypothetical protein [Myxococcales bacterium]
MRFSRLPWSRLLPWPPRGASACLLALLLCLVQGPARGQTTDEDQPAVAIIPFGAQSASQVLHINAACEQALRRIGGLRVLSAAQWEREARESGQGDDLEAMARRLDAAVLVTGSLGRAPGGWRLSVDVFDNRGMPLQSFDLDLVVPEIGPAASFRLEEALARIIRPAVGLKEQVEETPESGPEPAPQSTDREKVVPLADIEGIRPRMPPARRIRLPPWRPLVEGRAGLLVIGRTLHCGEPVPARLNLPCTDILFPFDGGAGLRLEAGLYPLARLRALPRPLAGLGLTMLVEVPGWRDRVLQHDGSSAAVRQLRFETGLRWRWNIGDRVRRPILELGVAYGYHSFVLLNDSVPYPDLQYQYLLPSLGLGGYWMPRASLRGVFALPTILTGGEATLPVDDRTQNPFGPGWGLGFRLLLEAEYLIWQRLGLVVGGSVERLQLWFDGSGCTKSVPGQVPCDQRIIRSEPPPPAVQHITDLFLSLWIQLGYRY